jgi:hypothetical protein
MFQRELAFRNHKRRQGSWPSSISRTLFALNSSHKVKQSTELIMWKYCSGYVKLWVDNAWTLTQRLDSPPWQCSSSQRSVKQFLAQKSITEMEQPTCSPDLAMNDFWLFPKIKSASQGWRFQDIEDIEKMWWQHWKIFHNRSCKNVSNSGSTVGLSA